MITREFVLTAAPVTATPFPGCVIQDLPSVPTAYVRANIPNFAAVSTGGYSVGRTSEIVDGVANFLVTTFEAE